MTVTLRLKEKRLKERKGERLIMREGKGVGVELGAFSHSKYKKLANHRIGVSSSKI